MARADSARDARTALAAATVLVAAALVPAASAAPAPGPLDPSSSIAQYVEDIPTAAGPRAAGTPATRPAPGGRAAAPEPQAQAPRSLPAPLAAQLEEEGGEDAEQLEEVATSPGYGAPQEPPRETGLGGEDAAESSVGGAAADAVASGDSRLMLLLAVIGATTLAALVAAGARARRRRDRI